MKDQTSKELTRLNYTLCFGPSMVAVHDHHLPRKFWSGVSSSDMNTLRHLLRNPIWQASTIARRQGENFASIWKIWSRGHKQFLKLATTALRASAARSGSEGIRHFKIRYLNFLNCAQFTNTNLPKFKKIKKVWQMTRRLKKYENLACEVLEGSTRFS